MKPGGFNSPLYIGEFCKAFPGLKFRFGDRLTREEAASLIQWAQRTPQIRDVLADKGHPDHRLMRPYWDLANYYAHEHPQAADGAPQAWPERPGRGTPTVENQFGDLFPDEIAELLEWAPTSQGHAEIMRDKSHPLHKQISELVVHATQHAVTADAGAAKPEDKTMDPAAQKRIDELRQDPAYLDGNHVNHKAAVEAVTRAYEAAYGGTTLGEAAAAAPAPGLPNSRQGAGVLLTPQQRIAALKGNAAYWDKGHAGHAAAVQEATAAYAAANPEPPPP